MFHVWLIFLVLSCKEKAASVKTTVNGRLLLGAYVPQCDEQGDYTNKQCHGSTGFCWCVNTKTGKEIEGTRKRGKLECGKFILFSWRSDSLSDLAFLSDKITESLFFQQPESLVVRVTRKSNY